MKKQSSILLTKWNPGRWIVAAIIVCALATILRAPHLRGQNDDTSAARPSAPLSGVTSSTLNPLQVALLHWQNADNSASFSVGTTPYYAAFDRLYLWVTNYNSHNVTKLRAADGYTMGTYTVGTNPIGVAIDGGNVWVTNYGSNDVTKLRAYDGKELGTFAAGTQPVGVAYDGTNIWVANYGSNNVTELSTSGANLGTFSVGSGPEGVAFDGTNIWVANAASNTVSKL